MRALALDFDGVVVDSLGRQERLWREALAAITPPATDTACELRLLENLWAGYAGERIFQGTELTSDQRRDARREKDRLWRIERSTVPLFPGARDSLTRLAAVLPVYIATTAPRAYVDAVLAREGLTTSVRCVITDEDVDLPKPHAEMLEKIAELADAAPHDVLLVGDSMTDLEMARHAGADFIRFAGGDRPDSNDFDRRCVVVRSWVELEKVIVAAAGWSGVEPMTVSR